MSQHRRSTSSGQDSAVHLHLKEKGHSFDDSNVRILDREDRWFERGVKEAIYVHLEKPSLNRGGGLRHHLSATYNAVLGALPRRINPHTHLVLCGPKVPHKNGCGGQSLTSDSNPGTWDVNDTHCDLDDCEPSQTYVSPNYEDKKSNYLKTF